MDTQTGLHPSTGCSSVVKSRERDGVMGRQVGNLQFILFIERSQSGKTAKLRIPTTRTFPKRQTTKRVKRSVHSQEFVAALRGGGC